MSDDPLYLVWGGAARLPYDYFRISETHSTRKVTWVRDKHKKAGAGPAWHSKAVLVPVLQGIGAFTLALRKFEGSRISALARRQNISS
jgi:hypothetical protein